MHASPGPRFAPWPLALTLLLGSAAPVEAYLDPGTGSFLFQILAALVIWVLYYLRAFRRKLLGESPEESEDEDVAGDEGDPGELPPDEDTSKEGVGSASEP